MKLYFAKWLPVEGEIKQGDKVLVSRGMGKFIGTVIGDKIISNNKDLSYPLNEVEKVKVKFFLCSRDVQKTDKEIYVHKPDGTEVTKVELIDIISDGKSTAVMFKWNDKTPGTLIQNAFKVIGQISPEATWVKEGDEFDKEEINLQWYDDSGFSDYPWFDYFEDDDMPKWEEYEDKYKRVQIKGPCGHFH